MKQASIKGRLLVVDDDESFLGVLQKILLGEGYEVVTKFEAKSAGDIFALELFDAVISDIRLPGGISGIELMHTIKKMRKVPVILMTGFGEMAEAKEASALGADGFLAKPFKRQDIVQAISSLVGGPKVDEAPDVDHQFCKMGIEDFVSGKDIRFDIHVRISAKKYIKVAHEGENIDVERIRAYKEKGISSLYLKKDDYGKYIGLNVLLAPLVAKSSQLDEAKKLNFLRHTSEIILEKVFLDGVDKEAFKQSQCLLENTMSVLMESEDTSQLLVALKSHSDFLYAHSLGVALYSTLLGRQMQWTSNVILLKLSIGGLFHDIGKREIDRKILEKKRVEMSSEEIALYETHTNRGMNILMQNPGISGDILQIVAQHHENCLGQGFPQQISKQRIHPLAKVVAVANEFCKFTIPNPNSAGIPARDAIMQMRLVEERYDAQAMAALKNLFKISTS